MGTLDKEEDKGTAERAEGQVISPSLSEVQAGRLRPTEQTKSSRRPHFYPPLSSLLVQERTGKQEGF